MMKLKFASLVVVLLLALLLGNGVQPGWAQTSTPWSRIDLIARSKNVATLRLVSDTAGDLHLFWLENPSVGGSGQVASDYATIFYTHWNGKSWSKPVDILTAPAPGNLSGYRHSLFDVSLSSDGYVTLALTQFNIYCTRAHLSVIGLPNGWSPLTVCGYGPTYSPSLYTRAEGEIHLVYPLERGNLYYTRSNSSGAAWIAPIQLTFLNNRSIQDPYVVSPDGEHVFVVWTEVPLPDMFPTLGIYFARSTDGGLTWSSPILLLDGEYNRPTLLAADNQNLHIIINGNVSIGGRYYLRSYDGGLSWLPAVELDAGAGGVVHPPRLALDSLQRLHTVITTGRQTWYLYNDGTRWSSKQDLAAGIAPADGFVEMHPEFIIVRGNQAHYIVFDEIGAIWHRSRILDAPELPAQPIQPPFDATATNTPVPPLMTPTPRPTLSAGFDVENIDQQIASPVIPLAIGLLPPVALLFVLIGYHIYRRQTR